MDYVFGTQGETEVLKTKGSHHTDLNGFHQVEQVFPDQTITDTFRVVRKLESQEDGEGNCYDWYEIDHHYRVVDKTAPLAASINTATQVTGITFVTMAEAGNVDATTASEHADLFAEWAYPVAYKKDQIRRDPVDGMLYQVIQDHTSQEDWPPRSTASLWKRIADPSEEWPEWSQPIGAHDAYNAGDKVSHSEKHWTSDVDANVWEPGVYGWTEVKEE